MIDFLYHPTTMILGITAVLSYIHDRNTQREAEHIKRNIEHLLKTFEEYEHRIDREISSKNNEKDNPQEERIILGQILDEEDLERIRDRLPKKYEKRTKKTSKPRR